MKKFKKFGAVLLALAILLSCVTVAVSAENVTLPETETQLDFVNAYSSSVAQAYDSYGITQGWQTGALSDGTANAYIAFKTEKNSPIVIEYKYMPTGDEKPEFYTSADGNEWTPLSLEIMNPNEQVLTYYTNGIGEDNQYIKIVICDTAIADVWRCDLRTLSYNPNTTIELPVTDTSLNFQSNYDSAFSKVINYDNVGNYADHGIVADANMQSSSYVVFETGENSPLCAKFYIFDYIGNPIFYTSPDGQTWEELSMDKTTIADEQYMLNYFTTGIGSGNKYIKIVICDQNSASWKAQLRGLSYNS